MAKKEETLDFEGALARLETISEAMNAGAAGLDESLTLYEEANVLIGSCMKKLKAAEHKVEVLTKNRNGDVVVGSAGTPLTEPLTPQE